MNPNWLSFGAIGVGAGGLIVMMLMGSFFWRWKLSRWAHDQGMSLVSFRDAGFWEGPGKRGERGLNEHLFRVETKTPGGAVRTGWAMFVTTWGLSASASFDWVKWDGAAGEAS